MRIPCQWSHSGARMRYQAGLLIAVDGDYCHVVDVRGKIFRTLTSNVVVNMGKCFSNEITAAVKP